MTQDVGQGDGSTLQCSQVSDEISVCEFPKMAQAQGFTQSSMGQKLIE